MQRALGVGVFERWGSSRDQQLRALFEQEYEPLCRLAYVMLRDAFAAEEAVMDAFLKAFTGWRRIASLDRPDLYVRKVVVNVCTSRLRRRAVEARYVRRAERSRATASEEFDLDVWAAVLELPSRQRACVVLRYFEDRTEEETAALLDCSVGTVKSQLAKARRKLKDVLQVSGAVER